MYSVLLVDIFDHRKMLPAAMNNESICIYVSDKCTVIISKHCIVCVCVVMTIILITANIPFTHLLFRETIQQFVSSTFFYSDACVCVRRLRTIVWRPPW